MTCAVMNLEQSVERAPMVRLRGYVCMFSLGVFSLGEIRRSKSNVEMAVFVRALRTSN